MGKHLSYMLLRNSIHVNDYDSCRILLYSSNDSQKKDKKKRKEKKEREGEKAKGYDNNGSFIVPTGLQGASKSFIHYGL